MYYNYQRSALYAKKSAYESIVSFGINNISKDSLRQEITDFYQIHLARVKDIETLIQVLNREEFNPLLKSISKPFNNSQDVKSLAEMYASSMKEKENAFLVENPSDEIIHLLKEKYQLYQVVDSYYAETRLRIDQLIAQIDAELEQEGIEV